MTSEVDMIRCVDAKVGIRPVWNAESGRLLLTVVMSYSGKAGNSGVLPVIRVDHRGSVR